MRIIKKAHGFRFMGFFVGGLIAKISARTAVHPMKTLPPSSRCKTLGAGYRDFLRAIVLCALPLVAVIASTCYGTAAHGRLEGGVRLPSEGKNYLPYRVDFMVPVLDGKRKPALLPVNSMNQFGYGLEFDATASLGDLRIDFEAWIRHDEHYHVDFLPPYRPLGEFKTAVKANN